MGVHNSPLSFDGSFLESDIIYLLEPLLRPHVITVNISAERNSGFSPPNQTLRLDFVHTQSVVP